MEHRVQRQFSVMSPPSIEGLVRREYSAAKLGWSAILLLQVVGLGLAVAGILGSSSWSVVLGFVGLTAPIIAASLRQWSQGHQSRGDELRRLMLVQRSLDCKTAEDPLLTGLAEQTSLPSLDPKPLGHYYDSERSAGPKRFVDNLAESAFFTVRLSRTAAFLFLMFSGIIGLGGIALLWMVANGWHLSHGSSALTQVPGALIAFAAGNEFLNAGLAFRNLKTVAASTLRECVRMRHSHAQYVDLMLLLCTYDCALAQSPPIPGILYRLQRESLDQGWKGYGKVNLLTKQPPESRT